MRTLLSQSAARQSWWWVFGLFIALPALALAVLGLNAIRADEIDRRLKVRDQQAQISRLADAALSTILDRELTEARARVRNATPPGPDGDSSIVFEIDKDNVTSFPAHRLYAGDLRSDDPKHFQLITEPSALSLIERASSASATGRKEQALALLRKLRALLDAKYWADLQLLVQRVGVIAIASEYPVLRAAIADAHTPSGIPLAIVVASYAEDMAPPLRRQFAPFVDQTLRSLREGRWWLTMDQRRVYDAELRRELLLCSGAEVAADPRLDILALHAARIQSAFATSRSLPPRAQVIGEGKNRVLLVWSPPTSSDSPKWTGIALSADRARVLLASALQPLVENQTFHAALEDHGTVLWGTLAGDRRVSTPLGSVPGWTITFDDPVVASRHRFLNYARVLSPVVVLACGLAMTAWIRRRELVLTELQTAFVAAVTHEFKSPLTSIRLLVERMSSGRFVEGDSPARYYTAIDAEAARLEILVNRLLEARQLQAGERSYEFRDARLEEIVRDAIERLRPQAEAKRLTVELRVAQGVPVLGLDVESVADAVRNLLDNAIKYSPSDTGITVELETTRRGVELRVIDQGIGIEPADAERIFEPFFRSRRGDRANVHGTGLGLALVRATAAAHRGTVHVSSDSVRGSCFTFTLPCRPIGDVESSGCVRRTGLGRTMPEETEAPRGGGS